MEHVHIAALRPDLDALESKQIKAVVTLIWPYSSSQRQFALLLAEPDFRLRRRKGGQVRARFSSTSARALAATGVGIGDEVVLSLHGAQFVQDGAVSTPGKSIEWELAYKQTVAISVRREGTEIANLEFINAVPTPAPRSPVKRAAAAPSPLPQWSSPAFLKRARLSNGPFFEQPAFDPLADAYNEGHDKKRRRKSYRDWTAWTYTTRTPSPEKEDVGLGDDLDEVMSSPTRRPQLPKTPISPSRTEAISVAAEVQEDLEYVEETTIADSADGDTTVDDGELRKVYAPLSTSPERPQRDAAARIEYDDSPPGSQYDFGGDTELNTEDEDEEEDTTVPEIEAVDVSATEAATELEDGVQEAGDEPSVLEAEAEAADLDASATEEISVAVAELQQPEEISEEAEETTIDETPPGGAESAILVEDALTAAMPPPKLPALHTDFAAPTSTELFIPIGRTPSSPNLQAVDSATLPLPSPFPGQQATSYFEQNSLGQQQAPLDGSAAQDEPTADDDADYIMENSFFSSISSSRAGGRHQDHETAFTPVRFTFGMDGAGWSRPLELSSPPPEDAPSIAIKGFAPNAAQDEDNIDQGTHTQTFLTEQSEIVEDVSYSSLAGTFDGDVTSALRARHETSETVIEPVPTSAELAIKQVETQASETIQDSSQAITLSSDIESEDGVNEVEDDDGVMVEPGQEPSTKEDTAPESEEEGETGTEFESEPESEIEEADVRQALIDEAKAQSEPETTTPSMEAGDRQDLPASPKDDIHVATQTSAAVSEVVDFGSPSGDESNVFDDGHEETADPGHSGIISHDSRSFHRAEAADEVPHDNLDLRVDLTEVTDSTIPENLNFDDFIGASVTQQPPIVLSSSPVREPASISIPDTYQEPPSRAFDDREPQLGTDEHSPFFEDQDLPGGSQILTDDDAETADIEMEAPATQDNAVQSDIKMESVEDGSLYLISQSEEMPQESATDLATEFMTAIPENGHKPGELQSKSMPATAPARNTRSKAKSAASPAEKDGYVSRPSTSMRHTRSKVSLDSTDRDTTSPTQSRGPNTSTATPRRTRDATQTSPYSLRSQSKQLSPEQSVTASRAPTRQSPRKLVRRDTDFDIVPSQVETRDMSGTMFEPSQGLGFEYSQLSQGRYSDVGVVKDSEENISHSESSISAVKYSDDDRVRADLSDDGDATGDVQPTTPQLKPPPSFLQSSRQTRSRSRSMGQQSAASLVEPPHSPRRSPRLTRSTFSLTLSPHIARTTRATVQVSSAVSEIAEDQRGEGTAEARKESITEPKFPIDGEDDRRSSPPAPHSAQQSSLQESHLLTPDDTQQSAMQPPLSFQAHQPEQSLLITPDLTQQSPAAALLRSFDIPLPGVETQPVPESPVLRTSPRRKQATVSPKPLSAVRQSSPIQQSSDAISAGDEDETLVTKPDPPSIGLSTPLAYYTPLRDLIYFLNRSSQFHSSSHPDILALCTAASTTPEKAKKGPRHWSTTLHITDASVWPETRTVQCFRAYATALPAAEPGDVVLLRAFKVESRKREPLLRSVDESAWCLWRYGKPVWGRKGGKWGEMRAREEVKGPVVERGVGEWAEVERLRAWYLGSVKAELETRVAEREGSGRELRSSSKAGEVDVE